MSQLVLLHLLAILHLITPSPQLLTHQTPIFGNVSLGYYYVHLFLGTPPQNLTFILDTGSSNFAVPCKPCTQCGLKHMNPQFDLSKSTTGKALTCSTGQDICSNCFSKQGNDSCQFKSTYVQQSQLEGYYAKDMVLLAENISGTQQQFQKMYEQRIFTTFGCITKETNLFKEQVADGILALAPNSPFNIVKQFYRHHYPFVRQNHTFSICLAQNGGVFSIGGMNKRLHSSGLGVNMRFRSDQNVYSLNISGMYMGETNLNLSEAYIKEKYGVFIDSGATLTHFQHSIFASITQIVGKTCVSFGCKEIQQSTKKCYVFPKTQSQSLDDQIKRFPNITLKVGREDRVDWVPHHYFIGHNVSNRQVCLAFGPLDRTILGTTWLIDRDVHFDMNREQVTIYDADCDYSGGEILREPQPETPDVVEKLGEEVEEQMSESDKQALMMSISIAALFILVGLALVVTCRLRNIHNRSQVTTTTQEPPSQQYHDEISITNISQETTDPENSSRYL